MPSGGAECCGGHAFESLGAACGSSGCCCFVATGSLGQCSYSSRGWVLRPREYILCLCASAASYSGASLRWYRRKHLLAARKALAMLVSYKALGRLARAPLPLTTRTGGRVTRGCVPQGPPPHGLAAAPPRPLPRKGQPSLRPRPSRRAPQPSRRSSRRAHAGRARRRSAATQCASPRTSPSTRRSA